MKLTHHPAIVDPILYEKVQQVFRSKTTGSFSKRKFAFNRLMQCGECYNTVTAEIKKGKYIYYHCTGYGKKHKIDYVSESKIDNMFNGIVRDVTSPFEFYDFLKDCLNNEYEKQRINQSRERDRLELEQDKTMVDMKKAYQDKIDGNIDSAFFKEIYNEYQNRLSVIEYRLNNLSVTIEKNFDIARETIELSYQAEPLYISANSK